MNQILNIETNYSLLSSLISIDSLISYAKENGITVLGINDPNLFACLEFYKACQKENIKPVIGLSMTIDGGEIIAYAKNYAGYKGLLKLSSILCERDIQMEDVLKYQENLIFLIPFANMRTWNTLSNKVMDIYLAYQDLEEAKEELLLTDKVVFAPKRLYIKDNERELLEYLYCIRDGKTIADHPSYNIHALPLELPNEMHHYTGKTGLKNIEVITSMINLEFPKYELSLPIYETKDHVPAPEYLRMLCQKGIYKRRSGAVTEKDKERLEYELSVIEKMGFANYFLVVYDFIRYAKQNGILVGPGRGSAAGSLVAYCLGITEIDPLQYDLLFERFLNPERITMPDIDTDIPDVYRDQIIDYVKDKYGHKKVAGIVTFGTLAAKQAIRDVSRVFNIPLYKVDSVCKEIPAMSKESLKEIYQKNERFRQKIDEDDSLKKMLKVAMRIEGFPRHTSSHAAGIVMSQVELDELVPLIKSDDMYLTGYTMNYLEELGLLKMDFLGITNLTTIMNILKDIETYEGKKINFNHIPLDDKDTIRIFQTADTTGIFQFESAGMKNFLRNLKADSFDDIVAAIALFRPGPAVNIDSYIRRKHKEEAVTYIDPSLENVLKSTNGIIIYQEQIMQIANVVAGYSFGEADVLRRAMSKKKMDVLKKEEPKFISGAIHRGYQEAKAKEIFDLILRFANYGFNKSHSVAYSVVAFKMAYLKAHYTKYFYSNLLSGVIGNDNKTREYINEAKARHLAILPPDINLSGIRYIPESDGIRYPLSAIHNVGIVTSEEIIKARNDHPFQDIFDFASRTASRSLTRKVMETLIDAGCFKSFHYNTATLYYNLDAIMNYVDLAKDLNPEFIMKPELEIVSEYPKEVLLVKEKETFGIYLNNHPTTSYLKQTPNAIHLTDTPNYFNKIVTTIVLVDNTKQITTKKGDAMMFLTGSDESGSMEFTLFPKVFASYPDIQKGMILKIIGNVEKRLDQYQIIVRKIEPIS